jgi:hypothetical protein
VHEITDRTVAFGVGLQVAGEGVPGAEVVPGEGPVGDHHVLGVLHQGVVDGDLPDLGVLRGQGAGEFRGPAVAASNQRWQAANISGWWALEPWVTVTNDQMNMPAFQR